MADGESGKVTAKSSNDVAGCVIFDGSEGSETPLGKKTTNLFVNAALRDVEGSLSQHLFLLVFDLPTKS